METIIAILFSFVVSAFGTNTAQTQLNHNQTNNTNSIQMYSGNGGQSGNGNIVITDNDKDN